jgi:hypothetical protein
MSPHGNQRAPPSKTIRAANIGIDVTMATTTATRKVEAERNDQRDVVVTETV